MSFDAISVSKFVLMLSKRISNTPSFFLLLLRNFQCHTIGTITKSITQLQTTKIRCYVWIGPCDLFTTIVSTSYNICRLLFCFRFFFVTTQITIYTRFCMCFVIGFRLRENATAKRDDVEVIDWDGFCKVRDAVAHKPQ